MCKTEQIDVLAETKCRRAGDRALAAGCQSALASWPVSRTPPGLRLDGAAFQRDIPGPRGHGDRCVAIDADTHFRGGPIVNQLHFAATQRTDGNDLAKLR